MLKSRKPYIMEIKIVILFFLFSLTFASLPSFSQNSELQGMVLDNVSQEVIPFSTISIQGASIGTCSNSRGEFIFHYPDSLKNGKLSIKCIGYKTNILKIESFSNKEIAKIYLEPEVYEIPEVNIGPNQPTAADYVKKVIKNMHKNYQRSPYYMEGFLRDKVFNLYDNKNVRLTESAVGIEKKEFGGENNAEKVKVLEIRNSYNYSKLNSSIKEKLAQAFWGYSKINPIYKTLQSYDYTNSSSLRELLRNELYSINLSGNTMFNGKPVIIIDIKEEYAEYLVLRTKAKNVYNLIRLYIEAENYAILKSEAFSIQHFRKESFENQQVPFHFKQDTIATLAVKQYEQIDGQYYLKYASNLGRIHDQPDASEMGKTLYFNETEFLVNKIITNKKEFDRIRLRNSLKKDLPLWDMEYTYNPTFWKNYNILIDKPVDPTVIKDLEQDAALDNQFIDGGERNSKLTK